MRHEYEVRLKLSEPVTSGGIPIYIKPDVERLGLSIARYVQDQLLMRVELIECSGGGQNFRFAGHQEDRASRAATPPVEPTPVERLLMRTALLNAKLRLNHPSFLTRDEIEQLEALIIELKLALGD